MIILIGGEKGGTGKTTIATNLAAMLSSMPGGVILVDADPQGSASNWAAIREENTNIKPVPCIQKFGKGVAAQVKEFKNHYGHVVIDTGGRDSIEMRACMVVADCIVSPCQASQFDIWTISLMERLVREARIINEGLKKAVVVINRAPTNPFINEAEEAREVFSDLEELSFLGIPIRDRIIFRKAAKAGYGVMELNSGSPASQEIMELYKEIMV